MSEENKITRDMETRMSDRSLVFTQHTEPTAPPSSLMRDDSQRTIVSSIAPSNLIYPTLTVTDPYIVRNRYMQEKIDNIKKDLKHYEKLQRRWKDTDSAFKITMLLITAGTGIGTVVTGGLLAPVLVTAILGTLTVVETTMSGILIGTITSRKKGIYTEKVNLIKEYLNKLFYLTEKIKEDKEITMEEVTSFDELVKQFRNDLQYFKYKGKRSNFDQTEGTYTTLSKNDIATAKKIVKEEKRKIEMGKVIEAELRKP